MKTIALLVVSAVSASSAFCLADVVTINPPNGVETNVSARLAGETSVAVNTGATGGGIVRLNSANSYSGGTTLSSGTLVVKTAEGAKGLSDIGTGDVTLGSATLKYVGPAGGVLDKTVTGFATAATKKACVLDVQNDLAVTGDWKQNYGTFIKTGPGTVTFRGKNNFFGATASGTSATLNDSTHKLSFNANGDGPTTGVRGGFVLAEGTMVIEGDETTTNYLSGSSSGTGAIGTWTVDSGKEKSAVLEIRGGQNFMPKAAIPGYHNGNATTGGEGVSSGIRVTGGYLQVGKDPSDSKDETFFFGGTSTPSGYRQNSHPFIEVTGGKMVVSKNVQLGNQGGVHTRLTVAGDGELEIGQYVGNGYSGTPADNPASNSVTIAERGVLKAQYMIICKDATNTVCNVKVTDGGRYLWSQNGPALQKQSATTPCTMNLLVDGGSLLNTSETVKTFDIFDANLDGIEIGTRGAKLGSASVGHSFRHKCPLLYRETVPGEERQPLEFIAPSGVKTYNYLYDGFSWDGPVRISPYSYIYVCTNATVNFGKVIHCRDARILSYVQSPTFGDYQLGEPGESKNGAATFFLSSGSSVRVTGKLTVASDTHLHVYMQKNGVAWNSGTAKFTTPGDYLVLTAPAASRAAIESICAKATYAEAENCTSVFHVVDNGDDTLSLKLKILAPDGNTLSVVGETVGVESLRVDKGYEKVEIGAGGMLVVQGSSTVSSADASLEFHVTDGGWLVQYESIVGHMTSPPYAPSFYIDGGIVACPWAGNGGAVKYLRYANFYVGAKGAIFDASLSEAAGGLIGGQYLHLGGTWAKDPALGNAPDGGITFRGHGLHYLGGTFTSTLEGDFTVADHAQLMAINETLANCRVVVKPGCGFRSYEASGNPTTTVGSLVLGEAGAVEPVVLSAYNKQVNLPELSYLIVKGELSVLSPVYYGVRNTWSAHSVALDVGTYNVVFFREGNVDASLFQADPSIANKKVTFEVKDVTEGAYAGYKAVVATVVKESGASAPLVAQRWTASSAGGDWTAAANWENGQKPGFAATMAPPQGAAVAVSLDERPCLRQLTVEGEDAEKGYVFGGANGLFLEAGALSDITKRFETFQSDVKVDVPVKVEGPVVVANRAGSTVEFAKGLSGSGAVNVNDRSGSARGVSGEVVFGEGFEAGQLRVGTGRVTIGSLGWAKTADDVIVNRGNLHYTGSGETIPGITFTNAQSCSAVVEIDNDLAVMSLPATGKGPFVKMGAGTLRFTGNGTFVCGQNNMIFAPSKADPDSSRVLANGDGPTNTLANFSVAQGKVVIGTAGDPNDAPQVSVSSQMAVGLHAGEGASPELVLNNGSLTINKNALRIGLYDTLGDRMTTPKVTVNGGVLMIGSGDAMNAPNLNMPEPYGSAVQNASPTLDVNGGEVVVKGSTRLGYCRINPEFPDQASTINVNGGAFTTGGLVLGNYDAAAGMPAVASYLNLNGGVTTVTNELNLNRNADGTSVLTLNEGATLKVGSVVSTRAGGKFVFNGGTLAITGAGSNDTKGEYLVGAKGAVVSTAEAANGQAVFTVVLKHDPSLGDKPDGGLVKKGPGILVISPDSTFTGPVVVEEGLVLKNGSAAVDESGDVVLPAGCVLSCYGRPGEWDAGVAVVPGDLSAAGRVYVDFGRSTANPIRLGERYPLAVVNGSVRGRLRLKPLNAGDNLQLEAVVEDGVLYAEVVVRGAMVIMR